MASEEGPITNLQRLELEHAQHDQGTIEDFQNSRTLTTDQSRFNLKYLLRLATAVSSIAIGTLAAYWGFSPPAAIITFISEDLGQSPEFDHGFFTRSHSDRRRRECQPFQHRLDRSLRRGHHLVWQTL